MARSTQISIAKNFSRFPAGRYVRDGPFPGEVFRSKLLAPALRSYDSVTVVLDGTLGYGSSFLEEAFGGLVRVEKFSAEELRTKLTLRSEEDSSLIKEIWSYIDDAAGPSKQTR